MFVKAGAAGFSTTVVDKYVLTPFPLCPLRTFLITTSPRKVTAQPSKDTPCGNDISKGEGLALAMKGRSSEKEVRRAENRVSVENEVMTGGDEGNI